MSSNLSLFIPHVFPNFTKEYIATAFDNIGHVKVIDMISKKDRDGKPYNAVYVHFNRWYENETASLIKTEIEHNGSSQLYHDGKWYWILLRNTSTRPGERKPVIDLSDFSKIPVPVLKRETAFSLEPGQSIEEYMDKLELEEEERQLEEVEAAMEEDDKYLVSIDGRYVATIEYENMSLRQELNELRREMFDLEQTISQLAAYRACNM